MLIGGVNGPGCLTASATVLQHRVCHSRIYPSGTTTVNWTRDAAAALTTATTSIMAVEWGSDWTVQRRRVQGTLGGDDVNATGEYNVAAINPVSRANTWVWGTGFTNNDGIGEAGEGVVVTLGDGVNQNGTEDRVAVATEVNGTAIDFEIYALTSPLLVVEHVKFANTGTTLANTVTAATDNTAHGPGLQRPGRHDRRLPEPDRGRRATARTRTSTSRGAATAARSRPGCSAELHEHPPVGGGAARRLRCWPPVRTTWMPVAPSGDVPGARRQADRRDHAHEQRHGHVHRPRAHHTRSASVTDTIVRPGVIVEYNNAGFATADSTLLYHHVIVNTGNRPDSFTITPTSELGWRVDLIDPNTGAILATDANGDGVWDGGVVGTRAASRSTAAPSTASA